ncbi:MAG: class A beta-lactamase [Dethiosulfovibrio peptidovorans]|nr:MAG: class A beta-lactamase [Dethiosulfovibrio peptidovorans]
MFNIISDRINSLSGTVGLVIEDLQGKNRKEWNATELFPAASVIKLPILWELFSRVEKKDFSLQDEVELLEEDKVEGFGILKEMHAGLRLSLKDIATLMIVLSDNVATNMLIDLLGMDNINDTIESLGLKQTSLQRKMMDSEAKDRGADNFTSPEDVALLLRHYLENAELSSFSRDVMLDILLRQQCNNKLPFRMPPGAPFAHKTGDLPGTEHDVGILLFPEKTLLVVVMTKDLRDNQKGIIFHNEIGELLYTTFAMTHIKE